MDGLTFFIKRSEIDDEIQLANGKQGRQIAVEAHRHAVGFDSHHDAAPVLKKDLEGRHLRWSNVKRCDLNIAIESLLQVTDGLLADHRLESPGKYRSCDESRHNNQPKGGGNSSEPIFLAACH